ncbi:hypothetical protein E2C01_052525 [Portunus trituberculatus]|uniref:Uncharacterized protein n=1 Tax=Portunus trituberculatus TaxID=210409 RepID=A0A5B7GLS1_PORTR|nr:hypothetical protein [Portunus trituberculatus]
MCYRRDTAPAKEQQPSPATTTTTTITPPHSQGCRKASNKPRMSASHNNLLSFKPSHQKATPGVPRNAVAGRQGGRVEGWLVAGWGGVRLAFRPSIRWCGFPAPGVQYSHLLTDIHHPPPPSTPLQDPPRPVPPRPDSAPPSPAPPCPASHRPDRATHSSGGKMRPLAVCVK